MHPPRNDKTDYNCRLSHETFHSRYQCATSTQPFRHRWTCKRSFKPPVARPANTPQVSESFARTLQQSVTTQKQQISKPKPCSGGLKTLKDSITTCIQTATKQIIDTLANTFSVLLRQNQCFAAKLATLTTTITAIPQSIQKGSTSIVWGPKSSSSRDLYTGQRRGKALGTPVSR